MTENSDPTRHSDNWWHGQDGAIVRTLIALTTGLAVGVTYRDAELGITAASGALSLLQETWPRHTR